MTPPDVWAAGSLDIAGAAKFLSISERFFRTVAAQQKWPRRYLGTKVLYPRAPIAAFLAALPSSPPPKLKAKAKRIGAKVGAGART